MLCTQHFKGIYKIQDSNITEYPPKLNELSEQLQPFGTENFPG